MLLRPLTPGDVADYRALRLAALGEHPAAYVSDVSEEEAMPIEDLVERLASETNVTFGAFEEGRLVGIGTLLQNLRVKQRFRATIVGMYVLPRFRRRGLARKLLEACVDRARTLPEVEEVCLCVTAGNEAARRVYVAFGFEPEYVEPRYFKHAGQYYDLEWLRLPLR